MISEIWLVMDMTTLDLFYFLLKTNQLVQIAKTNGGDEIDEFRWNQTQLDKMRLLRGYETSKKLQARFSLFLLYMFVDDPIRLRSSSCKGVTFLFSSLACQKNGV